MTKYMEHTIHPSHSGFGMWQVGEGGPLHEDAMALRDSIVENVGGIWELGVDELPKSMEDIRGSIYNQPDRVFGFFDPESHPSEAVYFGINEVEVQEEAD